MGFVSLPGGVVGSGRLDIMNWAVRDESSRARAQWGLFIESGV